MYLFAMTTVNKDIANNDVFNFYFTQVNVGEMTNAEALKAFHLFGKRQFAARIGRKFGLTYSFKVLKDTVVLFAKALPDESIVEVLERYFEYLNSRDAQSIDTLETAILRAKERLASTLQDYIDDGELPESVEKLIENRRIIESLREIKRLEREIAQSGKRTKEMSVDDAYDFLVDKYNQDRDKFKCE